MAFESRQRPSLDGARAPEEHRRARLAILHDLSARLVGERSAARCFEISLQAAVRMFPGSSGGIFQFRAPDRFERQSVAGLSPAAEAALVRELTADRPRKELQAGTALWLPGKHASEASSTQFLGAFPLSSNGELIGVLAVFIDNKDQSDAQDLLPVVANQTAAAVGYCLLVQEEVNSRRAVELTHRLAESRAAYWETLVETLQEAVLVINTDGTLLTINKPGRELLAMFKAPGEAASLACLIAGLPVKGILNQVRAGRRYTSLHLAVGHEVFVVDLQPIGLADEPAVVFVARNVTEIRRLERQKDEFLATASHELRTPLAVLRGYLEILHRQLPASPLATSSIAKMRSSVDRLIRLANELLEVTRIEAGKLPLQRSQFEMGALVTEVVSSFRELAHDRTVDWEAPGSPAAVYGDRATIQQILENLLSNAQKYTPAETPITVRLLESSLEVLVYVEDHGSPIAEGDTERIFERFVQGTSPVAQGGLGLGLYLSREIAKRHGGWLWVEPSTNGNTFILRIPKSPPEETNQEGAGI